MNLEPNNITNLRQISRVCGCQHHLPLLLKLATPWITTKLISKKSSHQNLGTHSNWCVIWKERTCNNWCGCVCVCARASSCNFIGIYNNHNPSLGVFPHDCKMLRQKIHMELPFNIANCLHIKTDNVNWTNAYMRVLCLTVFQWFFSKNVFGGNHVSKARQCHGSMIATCIVNKKCTKSTPTNHIT